MSITSRCLRSRYNDTGVKPDAIFEHLSEIRRLILDPSKNRESLRDSYVRLGTAPGTLFRPLPRRLLREAALRLGHDRYYRDRLSLTQLSRSMKIEVLRLGTYWFRALSKPARITLQNKFLFEKDEKFELFRSLIDSVDGLQLQLLFAFPDYDWKWSDFLKIQVMFISNYVFNKKKFQEEYKDVCASYKRYYFGDEPSYRRYLPRRWGFVRYLHTFLSSKDRTPLMAYRAAVLSQTRITGLSSDFIRETIEEYRQIVSEEIPKNSLAIIPLVVNTTFKKPLERLCRLVTIGNGFGRLRSKIVLSQRGSIESPESAGGKSAFYRFVLSNNTFEITDLIRKLKEYGLLDEPIVGLNIGQQLLAIALIMYEKEEIWYDFYSRYRREKGLKVLPADQIRMREIHVSTVLETGLKTRIVTSQSAMTALILQIESHYLLEVLKQSDELRCGLTSSRNGWDYAFQFTNQLRADEYRSLDRSKLFFYSTDRSQATDYAIKPMATYIINKIMEAHGMNERYRSMIIDLWSQEDYIKFPDGTYTISKYRLLAMGKPVTKAYLSLSHLLCKWAAEERTSAVSIAAFNGDDSVIATDSIDLIKSYEKFMGLLGYRQSEKDTFFSKQYYNYCEEYMHIPSGLYGWPYYAMHNGAPEECQYLDYPRIRLMLPVARVSILEDCAGKVSRLTRDMSYAQWTSPCSVIVGLAYYMQDIGLAEFKDFPLMYLPTKLSGLGRIPAWKDIRDIHRFYSSRLLPLRGRIYNVLEKYGIMQKLLHNRVASVSTLESYLGPLLSSKKIKSHLIETDLVACKVDYSGITPLVQSPAGVLGELCVQLRKSNFLVDESDIQAAILAREEHMFLSGYADLSRHYRSKSERKLLLLGEELRAEPPYAYQDALERTKSFFNHDYYDREEVDNIYSEGYFSLNIWPSQRLPVNLLDDYVDTYRDFKENLYRATKLGDYSWIDPTDFSDDQIILSTIKKDGQGKYIILTADYKLCREILANLPEYNLEIVAIHPMYLLWAKAQGREFTLKANIVDTGSVRYYTSHIIGSYYVYDISLGDSWAPVYKALDLSRAKWPEVCEILRISMRKVFSNLGN